MVLEAVGLARRYPGSARDTVSQVSFSIGSGETLGLLGESGSGKSTVGQMVARYSAPYSRAAIFPRGRA